MPSKHGAIPLLRFATDALEHLGLDGAPEHADIDNPLTSKEGWAQFVAEAAVPPGSLSPAALQQLALTERERHEARREEYHAQLVVVSTPAIRRIAAAGRAEG